MSEIEYCPHCGKDVKLTFDDMFEVGNELKRVMGQDSGHLYTVTAIGEQSFLAIRKIDGYETKFNKSAKQWEKVVKPPPDPFTENLN